MARQLLRDSNRIVPKLVYLTQEGKQRFLNVVLHDGTYHKFEVTTVQMDRICREYLNARL